MIPFQISLLLTLYIKLRFPDVNSAPVRNVLKKHSFRGIDQFKPVGRFLVLIVRENCSYIFLFLKSQSEVSVQNLSSYLRNMLKSNHFRYPLRCYKSVWNICTFIKKNGVVYLMKIYLCFNRYFQKN